MTEVNWRENEEICIRTKNWFRGKRNKALATGLLTQDRILWKSKGDK